MSVRIDDPATFDVVKNAFAMLCDEMATTLARSAYSPLIRQSLDCATGLLAADGAVIAQGRTSPLHLTTLMTATEAVLRDYDDLEEGDVYLVNDPFDGGSHLPDIFLIAPIYHDGTLAFFVGSEAHHADVGGRVAGSNAADSKEIFEEGLRLPAARLQRSGTRDRFVYDVIARNVRLPDQVIGDLEAQVVALDVGRAGIARLIQRFGYEILAANVRLLLDYSEHRAREEISRWPDGEYTFEDWIDDDGAGNGPIRIAVTTLVNGDTIAVDFAGTGDQVPAAINQPTAVTVSAAMVAVRAAMANDIPHNAGYMRPITVDVPPGCILGAVPPAAVSARALPAYRTIDAVLGCFAAIVPERMAAASDGGNTLATFAGANRDGKPFVWSDIHIGAWGARHDRDGIDGISSIMIAVANTPAEIIEREMPIRIQRYELVEDTCGAGRFRGGLSVARHYEVEEATELSIRSDRNTIAPYGLFGGRAGALGRNLVISGADEQIIASKTTLALEAGDVYCAIQAGGGGWGDPLERDPQAVWNDVYDEKITAEYARREHGVVLGSGGVDYAQTEALRSQLRARSLNDESECGPQ
jgi:N-methylhydantoinase B